MPSKTETKKKEFENRLEAYEEIAPLKKVMMWGEPGSEAVLAQLLPKEVSLFYDEFNVLEAREEFKGAVKLLESQGVEVVLVKDLLAEMIESTADYSEVSAEELIRELSLLGESYHDTHKGKEIADIGILDDLTEMVESDVIKYGENVAVRINQILSMNGELPLANVMYARDQSNLLGTAWIWSSMTHPIRRAEVALYRAALEHAGLFDSSGLDIVQVSGEGRLEGGDGIVHNGICYIGVGGRTNLKGVMQVAPSILNQGLRLMVPYDVQRNRGAKSEMSAMHLDTYWMPCGDNQVVACIDEANQRILLEIVKTEKGDIEIVRLGKFGDHLVEEGFDVIPLTKAEQKDFAPNFLNLGNNRVVLSLSEGNDLEEELGKREIEVHSADLVNITKGYGGLHCMTAALQRGS